MDTGVGIGTGDLDKLFKFFGMISKTKEINKGGMGLGLTISKMILHQLGGEIGVASEVDKGSRFYFTIPMIDTDTEGCGPIDSFRISCEDDCQEVLGMREEAKGQDMSPSRRPTDLKVQIAHLNLA